MNTATMKVKCQTCGITYKIFAVNACVDNCKNCPSGKVKEVK